MLGSKKYQICEKEEAEYFANVKFWDKDNEELRGDFQVFIKSNPPISSMKKEIISKEEPTILELHIHAILAGVLMNGFIQGRTKKKLNSGVLYEANKQIIKSFPPQQD